MIAKNELQDYTTRIIGHDILVDAPPEKGGTGNYIRPHEMLEAALAACINISIRMEARKKDIRLDHVETKVELNRNDPARTIFEYSFEYAPGDLDNEVLNSLRQAVEHCAVKKTLSKEIMFREK